SQNDPGHTRITKLLDVVNRSHAAAKLNRHIHRSNNLLHHRSIRRLASLERPIKIDDMNHPRSGSHKLLRHLNRTCIVNSDVRLSTLNQTHARTVLEIDCRYDEHYPDTNCITSSNNNPFVAIEFPPFAVRTPRQSVNVPPASSMIGNSGAQSQRFITGSSITSARPVATRR